MRIGLTGGIGSGKSTVAALLAARGAVLIDTDAIARSLTLPRGAAMPAIEASFGASVIAADGSLDRVAMRQRVFEDGAVKHRLESILHPLIGAECERRAAEAEPGRPQVFDVPLIDAREETQLHRVVTRSGWSVEAVRAVIAQQATRCARRAAADAVIFNDILTLEELAHHVQSVWLQWGSRAARYD
jgi:dephospho-CoA kinase